MAGAKRRTPYRKQVTDSVLYDFPEPSPTQAIVRIIRSHGSNLLEVEAANGDAALAMMPTKFRKLVWIKRGDLLIVSEAAAEYDTAANTSGRVRYLIDHVLYPEQVKHLKGRGLLPPSFAAPTATKPATAATASRPDGDAAPVSDDLWTNTNRRRRQAMPDYDDEEEDEDEEAGVAADGGADDAPGAAAADAADEDGDDMTLQEALAAIRFEKEAAQARGVLESKDDC